LTGDRIDLGNANTVTSSGASALLFQPLTTSRPMILGGSDSSGSLVFTTADQAALSGFGQITIGRGNSSGNVTTTADLTFSSSVTIQTPGGSGKITLSKKLTSSGDITLTAGGLITVSANVTDTGAGGQTLTLSGAGGVTINNAAQITNSGGHS